MKARANTGPATLALVYWLLVVCGLAAFTSPRVLELEQWVPLWAGTVLGTGLGQLLARARLRMWLAVFVVVNIVWIGLVMSLPIWWMDSSKVGKLAFMAFAPGALCGYLSLSERGGLVAFWLPTALWMLSILDRSDGAGLAGGESWLLLAGLAVLFVAFLHARETRRVALWRSCGAVRIAASKPPAVLRRAPLRGVAHAGWLGITGAAMLALTAWIAPHLWQTEQVDSSIVMAAVSAGGVLSGSPGSPMSAALECCPEANVTSVERQRVREYFPLVEATDEVKPAPAPALRPCGRCYHGVPIVGAWGGTPTAHGYGETTSLSAPSPQAGMPEVAGGTSGVNAATPTGGASPIPSSAPVAPTPSPATSPPSPPPASAVQAQKPKSLEAPNVPASPASPLAHPVSDVAAHGAVALGGRERVNPAALLFTLLASGLVVHLTMRPLRRLLTVRHLRSALWPESVDQRVSNLWQLALVGLRDAGWQVAPGEQPQELARRVGVPGLSSCATVLDRARHGVRVDADDLSQMGRDASSVYEKARGRVGCVARAAGWLRWPLV